MPISTRTVLTALRQSRHWLTKSLYLKVFRHAPRATREDRQDQDADDPVPLPKGRANALHHRVQMASKRDAIRIGLHRSDQQAGCRHDAVGDVEQAFVASHRKASHRLVGLPRSSHAAS